LTFNFPLNAALWSPMAFGNSTLAETNQRLEFTASGGGAVARLRGAVTGNSTSGSATLC
jgi:hypothetical protein